MSAIRIEERGDEEAVRRVNLAAFNNGPEAALVDKLRATCGDCLSFVAVDGECVIGHILFTQVSLDGLDEVGMGLAPMAVLPAHQGLGIGSELVRHGLDYLHRSGCPFVVVLGHAEYYPRFGFQRASKYRVRSQWEGVPDDAFMVIVFDEEAIPENGAVARYREEFDEAL